MEMKNWVPYIVLTGNAEPRSEKDIFRFESVVAIIKNTDTWLYLALEFMNNEYWLLWGKVEEWEEMIDALLREVEEESWYKNSRVTSILFNKAYSRWYKLRKKREEESRERVYVVEVSDSKRQTSYWNDYGIEWEAWFTLNEMIDHLSFDHDKYYFKDYKKHL